ncbi:MAG TPA: PilZ domain-containing protein [Pyrinomonadaceae bacterium]|nr:PilZ domain-containing protein [Pyrinomonadaceae bacterium]
MAAILTEGRGRPRVKVTFRIEWGATGECEHDGDSVTVLSSRGCFIRTSREARKGDTVFLRLWESPGGGAVLECRIAYVLRVGVGFPALGLGMDFVGLSDEQQDHLEHLLEFYREAEAADSPPLSFDSYGRLQGSRGVSRT